MQHLGVLIELHLHDLDTAVREIENLERTVRTSDLGDLLRQQHPRIEHHVDAQ